ncbi:MAG: hypothetical protein JRC92_04660, partial [Deltaproteobacteria bacterium]|nr:hypothetical protein [Deltaproteobacteria bacterium]
LRLDGHSYESLGFHLVDSSSYRCFMKLGLGDPVPSASTLQANIKRLSAKTWEAINRALLDWAEANGIEKGRKVRVDTTGVGTPIHLAVLARHYLSKNISSLSHPTPATAKPHRLNRQSYAQDMPKTALELPQGRPLSPIARRHGSLGMEPQPTRLKSPDSRMGNSY